MMKGIVSSIVIFVYIGSLVDAQSLFDEPLRGWIETPTEVNCGQTFDVRIRVKGKLKDFQSGLELFCRLFSPIGNSPSATATLDNVNIDKYDLLVTLTAPTAVGASVEMFAIVRLTAPNGFDLKTIAYLNVTNVVDVNCLRCLVAESGDVPNLYATASFDTPKELLSFSSVYEDVFGASTKFSVTNKGGRTATVEVTCSFKDLTGRHIVKKFTQDIPDGCFSSEIRKHLKIRLANLHVNFYCFTIKVTLKVRIGCMSIIKVFDCRAYYVLGHYVPMFNP